MAKETGEAGSGRYWKIRRLSPVNTGETSLTTP